jgi:Cdc6-like AAA superfamily ATPase
MAVIILYLCLLSCSSTLSWLPTGSKYQAFESKYVNLPKVSRMRNFVCPVVDDGKFRAKRIQIYSSFWPSWTNLMNLQKIFSKPTRKEQDAPGFFNRDLEITDMKTILNGTPSLTIMLGPPSTGKTRLMKHLLDLKKTDGTPEFHAINLNLRGLPLGKGEQLWDLIASNSRLASEKDKAWISLASSSSKINSLKVSTSGIKVSLAVEQTSRPNSNGFDSFVESVPVWNDDGDSDTPFVLVIDEANSLKKLAESDRLVSRNLEF